MSDILPIIHKFDVRLTALDKMHPYKPQYKGECPNNNPYEDCCLYSILIFSFSATIFCFCWMIRVAYTEWVSTGWILKFF